jgi:5-methylcytosine-specific restriction endonuclease McrBC regulatory subunit McrC
VKLAIAELYQENMELRQQLVKKTIEASIAQGREGNVTWIKRKLKQVQDMIVHMGKTQRFSEERYAKQSKECETVEEIARVVLTNEHKKQD